MSGSIRIVTSNALLLSTSTTPAADDPVIGIDNDVLTTNIAATSEQTNFPATNLANPSTYPGWKSNALTNPQYVTFTVADVSKQYDYLAIAKHNFGTGQITTGVEINKGAGWVEVVADYLPATDDDAPLIYRWSPDSGYTGIRLRLKPGATKPEAAVMFVGKLLYFQRRIYVGHTPITYGRNSVVESGVSESGQFLGRIVTRQANTTTVNLHNLTAAWYRQYLDSFVVDSKESPFFFAWRPSTYPYEVGFAWLTNNPRPVNESPNGMMGIDFEMEALA
jgi:hypothetical protein